MSPGCAIMRCATSIWTVSVIVCTFNFDSNILRTRAEVM